VEIHPLSLSRAAYNVKVKGCDTSFEGQQSMQQTFLGAAKLAQYLISVVASGLKELLFLLPVPNQGVPVLRLVVQLARGFFAHRFTAKPRAVLF